MASNSELIAVAGKGWRRGLGNLLSTELASWFKTRSWLVQAAIWIAVIDFILFIALYSIGQEAPDVTGESPLQTGTIMFSIFAGMFAAIGTIIIMQEALVGEKLTGTAAWVLSKPVSRPSFVLSQLFGNLAGILVSVTLIPSFVAYFILSMLGKGGWLPAGQFALGVGALYLNHLFFCTFTLMLGAFFNHRGPVIGIPLALLFAQQWIIGLIPQMIEVLPYAIALPNPTTNAPSISGSLILGIQPDSYMPLIWAVILSTLFSILAVWRFGREEF